MNGRIWLESAPGHGAIFLFEVELERAEAHALASAPQLPAALRGQRALIVDDNASARQILQAQLVQLGMLADAVDSGAAALAALRRASSANTQYPVVLIDGAGGAKRAGARRRSCPRGHLPADISGVAVADGLRRCGGNAVLYRDLRLQFHGHFGDAAARMEALYLAGQFEQARQLAHTIKGAAANLSMVELGAAAGALEAGLRAEPAPTGDAA